jgi:aerobic-type carbon monoxide dehydrogenase small subunit (CoxS/CutS family)
MITLRVNGRRYELEDVDPRTPLLWVLRDELGLTGTKYGCGMAQCGTCTVHIDGEAARACVKPVGSIGDAEITTIEGLSENGDHPLQQAWKAHGVPQCGYCQGGQIMSAAAMLAGVPNPTDDDIDAGMAGNICRCGTYQRVRAAIRDAAKEMSP